MDHNLEFVIVQFHVPIHIENFLSFLKYPALSPSCPIALSPYRLIARIGGANYDNPEGERRWAICVKSATYQGGVFLHPALPLCFVGMDRQAL